MEDLDMTRAISKLISLYKIQVFFPLELRIFSRDAVGGR